MSVLAGYATFVDVVRIGLFYLAAAAAAVCAVDWAVRTRRLNPFGGVARFFRARVDPLMQPIERRIVRAGGVPTAAPWWMLGTIVVGGILLISLLRLVGSFLSQIAFGIQDPRGIPMLLVSWAFSLLRLAIIVRVISSWFPKVQHSPWVRWSYPATEWMLAPMRRIIPLIGSIDITPLVAWFLLGILQNIVASLL
jgi:YggT family protein